MSRTTTTTEQTLDTHHNRIKLINVVIYAFFASSLFPRPQLFRLPMQTVEGKTRVRGPRNATRKRKSRRLPNRASDSFRDCIQGVCVCDERYRENKRKRSRTPNTTKRYHATPSKFRKYPKEKTKRHESLERRERRRRTSASTPTSIQTRHTQLTAQTTSPVHKTRCKPAHSATSHRPSAPQAGTR